MRIGLRAGHTPGTGAAYYLEEHSECVAIFNAVKHALDCTGIEVIDCTSVGGTLPANENLKKGVSHANETFCDLFVSLHLNSCYSPDTGNGCECLVYPGSSSTATAEVICKNIVALGWKNRGVKLASGLHELNSTKMPAIIVESFFLNHLGDVAKYKKVGASLLGFAIASPIIAKALSK